MMWRTTSVCLPVCPTQSLSPPVVQLHVLLEALNEYDEITEDAKEKKVIFIRTLGNFEKRIYATNGDRKAEIEH